MLSGAIGACGGDSTPTGDSAAQPASNLTANDLVPNLDDLGFKLAEQGKEPVAASGLDSALALYKKQGSAQSVQLRVYVFSEDANAEKQWSAYAEAFRNPSADVLGTTSKNVDAVALPLGQLQKSYVTDKPDGAGNLVWTDIYRKGKVVLLVQVLDAAKSDGTAIRKPVAERVLSKVK